MHRAPRTPAVSCIRMAIIIKHVKRGLVNREVIERRVRIGVDDAKLTNATAVDAKQRFAFVRSRSRSCHLRSCARIRSASTGAARVAPHPTHDRAPRGFSCWYLEYLTRAPNRH